MEKSANISEEAYKNLSPIKKKILIAIISTVVLLILLVVGQITIFFQVFDWLVCKIRIASGLDIFLVKGIAVVLLALIIGTPISGLIWSFLPFPQKNKKRKRFIFLLILASVCFVSFFVTKDVYFNSETGEPIKYYSIRNDKYEFSSSGGYDVITGQKLKPVIKEVVMKHLNGDKAIYFPEDTIVYDLISNRLSKTKVNYKGGFINTRTDKEKNSDFRLVKFKNNSYKNFIFFITTVSPNDTSVLALPIIRDESISIYLKKGKHIFGIITEENKYYDVATNNDAVFLRSIKYQREFNPIWSTFGLRFKFFNWAYLLDINNSTNHSIDIHSWYISYNQEDIRIQSEKKPTFAGVMGLIFMVFAFCYFMLRPSSYEF